MKISYIVVGMVVLAVLASAVLWGNEKGMEKNFSGDPSTFVADGVTMSIQYTKSGEYARLSLSGVQYDLERARSASGAKYVSDDENIVFWEKGGTARLEIAGETVVENAINTQADNVLTFMVGPRKVTCTGVGPQECLIVNGEYFYDSISGFEYEAGFEYELLVTKTERENVPADASAYEYTLLTMVSKTAVDPLAGEWVWSKTQYNNDQTVRPQTATAFTLTFNDDQVAITTDCNNGAGAYETTEGEISFGPIASTKKACLGESQEQAFFDMLAEVQSYFITEQGDLILQLRLDVGSMVFKKTEPVE